MGPDRSAPPAPARTFCRDQPPGRSPLRAWSFAAPPHHPHHPHLVNHPEVRRLWQHHVCLDLTSPEKKNPPQGAAELCQASQRLGRRAAVRFGSFEALQEAFTTPGKQRRRSDMEDQVCNSAGIPVNAPHTEKNIEINEIDENRPNLEFSPGWVCKDPSPPCQSSDGASVLKES